MYGLKNLPQLPITELQWGTRINSQYVRINEHRINSQYVRPRPATGFFIMTESCVNATTNWIIVGLDDGLLPNATKPLSDLAQCYHQLDHIEWYLKTSRQN